MENIAQYLKGGDENFPDCLVRVRPQVKGLWYRGEWGEKDWEKTVAVVGSRKMSRYGKQVVSEVVPRLVVAGYTIVSGLMYGVDQEAHRVTLENDGRAIGVLGYGIDYVSENGAMRLGKEIVKNHGVVVSEYEGETVSQRWMFPQRNRVVVGLSSLVIVIEAGKRSGSLNTVAWAQKFGKTVYAVPGSVFSPTSAGTNALIADGVARGLTRESLRELTGQTFGGSAQQMKGAGLPRAEREVWTRLKLEGPRSVNELGRIMSKQAGEVLATLAQMEMKGIVREERGVWRIS